MEVEKPWYLRFYRMLFGVWTTASDRNIGLISAGVAFFGMFAIFPAIAAVIAVFGLLADPVVVAEQLALMKDIIPSDAYAILTGQIMRLLGARGETLGWATFVSIALALWAARAGVAGLIGGLNEIAKRPPRNGIKQIVVALTLTICLVALAVTALFAVIVAPIILAFAPLTEGNANVLEGVRWVVALVALYAALSLLYRFGPNQRHARLRWFTIGAVTVIFLWIAASFGLSYYLSNFASYNEVYGSIGAVIGMLLWLYITAYLILLGAALNLHIHGKVAGDPVSE
ncbi:membrane protein [Cognatiyoonia koreensis]|uniref:Membrane protein n=1 Tax=Cognatiyoonia koreensis TaxID=364200 RepID=A0A1I0NI53_9RHOB|nr:YihY/virulence factor BrkB family protein [Cognatiyoonia koreensis]SEW00915.1 membrane protein [Cognatiyoonia koreensis]